MATAEQTLAAVAAGITPSAPARLLLSDLDGAVVSRGREFVHRLVRQVTAPVRWDLCMHTLAELGVTGLLELPRPAPSPGWPSGNSRPPVCRRSSP